MEGIETMYLNGPQEQIPISPMKQSYPDLFTSQEMTLNSSDNLDFANVKLIEKLKNQFLFNDEFSLCDLNSKVKLMIPAKIKKLRSETDTVMEE